MKKKIIIMFFLSLFFKQGNASCMFFLRLISDKGDTTDIYVSDVVRIDTARNLLILSPQLSGKLKDQSFKKGTAILNNKGESIKINIQEALSSSYIGDPSLTVNQGNLFMYSANAIIINGEVWKEIALRDNIPIK
jgi:hypothetical protein